MCKTRTIQRLLYSIVFVAITVCGMTAGAGPADTVAQLIQQGKYEPALAALEKQPGSIAARFQRAWLLQQLGQPQQAIAAYEALVKDHPHLPGPWNNLAVLYAARGEHKKARAALLSAINTHPSYATAYKNLGSIYTKMAQSAYERALGEGTPQQTAPLHLSNIDPLPAATAHAGEQQRPAGAR
ncbi:MAG: tetratricopeptide repeat protein [Granulosicoccaceae bacterium]